MHKPVSFTNLEELKMYSTINAHRALEYLLENTDDNTQRSFCLAVMRAYFEKGLNISVTNKQKQQYSNKINYYYIYLLIGT